MPFTDDAKNYMLNQWAANKGLWLSLHTSAVASPGATGLGEVAGGAPAYARKAAVWGAAAVGSTDLTPVLVFDVPALGANVLRFVGVWTLAAGGVFQGWAQIPDFAAAVQTTYTLADFDADLNLG